MIELQKKKKKKNRSKQWILTKADTLGFHHQLNLTLEELLEISNLVEKNL